MRLTHFTKNTFNNHYLSMATFDRILQKSGRNDVKVLSTRDEDRIIKPKHFTPMTKKVTLPKI